ncbi:transposase [Rhodococcus sp. SMB37]|nr:transposase [Rhodococcus sp. SMB37]
MSRKNYSEEFRRQAVELYESTPGATIRGIAADLGLVRGTLTDWIDHYGTGTKTHVDGTRMNTPSRPHRQQSASPDLPETVEQKLARLEAENAALRAETTKLTTEREILRKAAKYFAGETNW